MMIGKIKRARRRRDLCRMKAKARRVRPGKPAPLAEKEAEYLAACSCWMCRNRRAIEGPTLQERRFDAGGEA